jgi:hypothetical protein
MKMKNFARFVLIAIVFLAVNKGFAATVTFTIKDATLVTETFTDGEWLDDDVDFSSGEQPHVTVTHGDTLVWNQDYSTWYHVVSSDLADIDELTLFTRGGGVNVDVLFYLTKNDGEEIPQSRNTWAGVVKPNVNLALVNDSFDDPYDGDDVLGNLYCLHVHDFHIEITPTNGDFEFYGGRLYWEADDIEKVPEPATLSLLAIGSLALLRRRKR